MTEMRKKEILAQLKFIKHFDSETEGLTAWQKKMMLQGAVSSLQKELTKLGILNGHEIL